MLNFNNRVTKICRKSALLPNVLLRLSKFLDIENKSLIYKSFIRSNFNFYPFGISVSNLTQKIEKLQHRTLRITFNAFNSPYTDLLNQANIPTLHLSRTHAIAKETFNSLHKISPEYLNDLVDLKNNNYSLTYVNSVKVPSVKNTNFGKRSNRFKAAQVWNSVPNELWQVKNYKRFRMLVHTWTSPFCKYSYLLSLHAFSVAICLFVFLSWSVAIFVSLPAYSLARIIVHV